MVDNKTALIVVIIESLQVVEFVAVKLERKLSWLSLQLGLRAWHHLQALPSLDIVFHGVFLQIIVANLAFSSDHLALVVK